MLDCLFDLFRRDTRTALDVYIPGLRSILEEMCPQTAETLRRMPYPKTNEEFLLVAALVEKGMSDSA